MYISYLMIICLLPAIINELEKRLVGTTNGFVPAGHKF
jgi:hypothetical protein